jgi:hypothetical protein
LLPTTRGTLFAPKQIIKLVIEITPKIIKIRRSAIWTAIILWLLFRRIGRRVLTTLRILIPFGGIGLGVITPARIVD